MSGWIVTGGIAATLLLAAPADPGIERAGRSDLVRRAAPVPGLIETIEAELDPLAYDDLLDRQQLVLEDFPLPGPRVVDLQLTAFDVLAADARLVLVDEAGERDLPRPDFRSFRGQVQGDPDSTVTLSLFDGTFAGSIHDAGGEFVITPARGQSVRIWNRRADPDQPDRPFCGADPPQDAGKISTRASASADATITEDTLLTAHIAIEATYEWYENFGTLTAAQNYILNLMAQVSTIYHDEVRVDLEVPFLRVFTVPDDPYTDTTDTMTLLSELRAEWNANQTGTDRTVAHLFSVRPSGGAGVAYLDVLCDNDSRPGNSADYGVSTISARGGSWEKDLVAHELGHNFSSPHTHCYVPEIDQCSNEDGCYSGPTVATTGTIMSYCNSSISEFHPRVEDERIRPAAEAAYPSCITTDESGAPDPPQNLRVD